MKPANGTLLVFSNWHGLLTGVSMVRVYADSVELEYTDQTRESAPANHFLVEHIDWENPMSIVGSVQEAARRP